MERSQTQNHKVRFWQTDREIEHLWKELEGEIGASLRSGEFVLGPTVIRLESEMAKYLGVRHGVSAGSGSDAMYLALKALGVRIGDEVITNPLGSLGITEAISRCSAITVFADIDEDSLGMSEASVRNLICERTRAVVPVYPNGQPWDTQGILNLGQTAGFEVIEDISHALGGFNGDSRIGAAGYGAVVSFHLGNILGCYGDAGMLLTDNDHLAKRATEIRAVGPRPDYVSDEVILKSRADDIQSAILLVKLRHLEEANYRRAEVAQQYNDSLKNLKSLILPTAMPNSRTVAGRYMVRIVRGDRDEFVSRLSQNGVEVRKHYSLPTKLNAWIGSYRMRASLPVAFSISEQIVCLPLSGYMSEGDVNHVCDVIRKICE